MAALLRAFLLSTALLWGFVGPARGAVDVVVTIKPLHSLIAALMEGIGEPHLIVRDGGSPHTYSLKPSDARALQDAELVFWIGAALESFLVASLETLAESATLVAAAQAEGLTLLSYRDAGPAGEAAAGGSGQHGHGQHDMHLWLDPGNAIAIVHMAAAALATADSANAERYTANRDELLRRLESLDRELDVLLAPVRNVPFIVFHDAYQYLEHRYDLTAVGSVTVDPDRQPGVERLRALRRVVAELDAACAFMEPQFEPRLIDAVLQDSDVRKAVLDPLGAALESGPELYFSLMRANAQALHDCLAENP